MDAVVREARLAGPDGTELSVQEVGTGRLVVLANGLGGSLRAWGPVLERFGPGHRVVAYDYRGLYASVPRRTRTRSPSTTTQATCSPCSAGRTSPPWSSPGAWGSR